MSTPPTFNAPSYSLHLTRLYQQKAELERVAKGISGFREDLMRVLPPVADSLIELSVALSDMAQLPITRHINAVKAHEGPVATMLREKARVENRYREIRGDKAVAYSRGMSPRLTEDLIGLLSPKHTDTAATFADEFMPYLRAITNCMINVAVLPLIDVNNDGTMPHYQLSIRKTSDMIHRLAISKHGGIQVEIAVHEPAGSARCAVFHLNGRGYVKLEAVYVYDALEDEYYLGDSKYITSREVREGLAKLMRMAGWDELVHHDLSMGMSEWKQETDNLLAEYPFVDLRSVEGVNIGRQGQPWKRLDNRGIPYGLSATTFDEYLEWWDEDQQQRCWSYMPQQLPGYMVAGYYDDADVPALWVESKVDGVKIFYQLTEASNRVVFDWMKDARMVFLKNAAIWLKGQNLPIPEHLLPLITETVD